MKLESQSCPYCNTRSNKMSEYFAGAFICQNRKCSVIAFEEGKAFWLKGAICTDAETQREYN